MDQLLTSFHIRITWRLQPKIGTMTMALKIVLMIGMVHGGTTLAQIVTLMGKIMATQNLNPTRCTGIIFLVVDGKA